MTPRDAAIRLFDRVVRTASSGDTAGARAFAPMAIAAYEMVPDKTLDDRYHVAVIHFVDGNYPAARAAADSILSEVPTHLFGLGTAAQAAAAMGDDAAARSYYESLLENFDAEVAAGRGEYEEHPLLLPQLREDAERYLAGGP